MCVGKSLHSLTGVEPVSVAWETRALYRVLRGVRQRASRSVDREYAGRNASEAIEPRQIFGTRMPSNYRAAKATPSRGPVLERIRRGPSAWHACKVSVETQEIPAVSTRFVAVLNQSPKAKIIKQIHGKEVRCFHSSEKPGQIWKEME